MILIPKSHSEFHKKQKIELILSEIEKVLVMISCAQTVDTNNGRSYPAILERSLFPTSGKEDSNYASIFAIPIFDQIVIYAPLHNLAALVDGSAAQHLRANLISKKNIGDRKLDKLLHILNKLRESAPRPKQGDFSPAFLGLLPTRGCTLSCQYCGFLSPDASNKIMDLKLAKDAVNWYMNLVRTREQHEAEIHYFGGEPFCAEEVLDFTVNLARMRAAEIGCTVRFEVATNGVFSKERCQWAADNLDTIVLSFDGPAHVQDQHRPYKNGRGSFAVVDRSAKILSEGAADLYFRACVTGQTVDKMPEIAAWFCQNYRPRGVCFEPVQPMAGIEGAQLEPPDPWHFARNFIRAARILEVYGVEPVYTAADISAKRVTFCPVGEDTVIVSPDGAISACYLFRHDWENKGFNLTLGRINGNGTVKLQAEAVTSTRALNVWNKPTCAHCFCKWHCAGGCHVNHTLSGRPGDYDRLCLQTRTITLRNILKAIGRDDLSDNLLDDAESLKRTIRRESDLLFDMEEEEWH